MATIYDVAREAGVSPKTVSRVINGDAPVNERTRQNVEEAMGLLAYVPSSAARAMRSNKTGLVGLLTGAISKSAAAPEASGLPEIHIVQSLQRVLADAGITPLIADTDGDPSKTSKLAQTFAQHRVEALIYIADYHQKVELPPSASSAPMLLVNCYDEAGTPCILPDDRTGQRQLVKELIAAGHRRIGFLTLVEGLIAHDLRLEGYKQALLENELPFDPELVISAGLHHAGPQETVLIGDAVSQLMALTDPPTVICCGNDRMAMQLYGILRSRGIAVPGELSVAGFDDYRMISETLFPPLTTAVLPYHEMGLKAGEILLDTLRGDRQLPQDPILVNGPTVWRQSVLARTTASNEPNSETGRNP